MPIASILLGLGAPVLANIIGKKFGGAAGALVKPALEALGSALGADPTPEAITSAIEADPQRAGQIVQQIERNFAEEMQIIGADMADYREVLRGDQKAPGLLARIWRPIFALIYGAVYFMFGLTICRAIWISDVHMITTIATIGAFLGFFFSAGAAVLGVYVWGRSGEKKAGVS